MGCERIDRVAMLSVHTSPLEQPGTGDAGGLNVYVVEVARQLARRDVAVEIFTRTTTADLILTVTVVARGAPATFTSEAGECTVGMAEKLLNVTGSFVCPEITSDDGRVTLKITGTYKT